MTTKIPIQTKRFVTLLWYIGLGKITKEKLDLAFEKYKFDDDEKVLLLEEFAKVSKNH